MQAVRRPGSKQIAGHRFAMPIDLGVRILTQQQPFLEHTVS